MDNELFKTELEVILRMSRDQKYYVSLEEIVETLKGVFTEEEIKIIKDKL